MTLESAALLLLAIVLLAGGHVCARLTATAQEMWWVAAGCLVAFANSTFGIGPGIDLAAAARPLRDGALPLLVFAGAYAIDRRCIGMHRVPVMVLPLVSITLATCAIAWVFSASGHVALAMPLASAVALGAVLASTDATSVTAQLKLRAPRGIRLLLSGETVVAAAFGYTIVDAAVGATSSPTGIALHVAASFAGGATIGAAFGWITLEALRRMPSETLVHWAIPLAGLAAYVCASFVGASSVAACLLAGLLLARRPDGEVAVPFWSAIQQAIRGLVFLATGYFAADVGPDGAWPYLAAAFLLAHGLRLAAVYSVTSVIHALTKFAITLREQALISVFSVRGATTLALALSLPAELPSVEAIRSIALVVVAFDLLVTTPATPWLARRFANHAPRPPVIVPRRRIAN